MDVTVWKLNAVQVLAFSCLGLALGIWTKRKLPVLDRLNIPASIIGGLMYACLILVLRDRYLNFEMDLVLRDILMVAFFTTIGLGASLKLLRRGGVQVGLFFAIATVTAVFQNVVGVTAAKLLGLNPLIGIISGSVALTGGPATALAFGKSFEEWGVTGASTVGLASAMFGILAGGLMGGAIGGSLIQKRGTRLRQEGRASLDAAESIAYGNDPLESHASLMQDESVTEQSRLMSSIILIAAAMGIGSFITALLDPWLKAHNLALPAYIGAMLAASVLRNLDDATGWFRISSHTVDAVGEIALNIFIVMALLTLQLWQLLNLALPMMIILLLQAALVVLVCRFIVFRIMGRDYEAAVMSGGFCGFMMGTTANSMACMSVLTEKYGPAPRAYIVVPLVGAFLIDFTNALLITTMANFLR